MWLLGHDILGNLDCAGANLFLTKYDNTPNSKLMMANLWDFDNIFRMNGNWSNAHIWGGFYYPSLLSNHNKSFRKAYIEAWDVANPSIFNIVKSYMENFAKSEEGLSLQASIEMDNKIWKSGIPSVPESVSIARDWFGNRQSWLSDAINGLR